MNRRGKNLRKLEGLVEKLLNEKTLSIHHHDRALVGSYVHHRECHIEPDWLLIYKLSASELRLERTGSHSDLF